MTLKGRVKVKVMMTPKDDMVGTRLDSFRSLNVKVLLGDDFYISTCLPSETRNVAIFGG